MQDKIVVDIGRIARQTKGSMAPYELFVQNAFPEKSNYPVVLAVFKVSDDYTLTFQGVDPENGSARSFLKYGFRKGSSRGGDITFTTKMSESFGTKLNTLKVNQLPAIIKASGRGAPDREKNTWIGLKTFLDDEAAYNRLLSSLLDYFEGLGKDEKKGALFSIRFEYSDGVKKYVGDFETFQNLLLANGTQDKSEKYSVKSEGYDHLCSICRENKPVLYGFASPFKYFTVDKPGFVSGFFKQENTWKNYPICSDCSLPFELGRDYISQNLQSYFYGRSFYMIPKPAFTLDDATFKPILKILKDIYKEVSVAKADKVEGAEDFIMEQLGEKVDNDILLNLMFFEEDSKTKAIKIRLLLEEILPSRFQTLFSEVPKEINEHPLYEKAIIVKKEPKDLRFSFGILKNFFDDEFLDVVKKVFDGQPISKELVFSRIMALIRSNYARQQTGEYAEPTVWTVKKAHMLIRYFQELNMLTYQTYSYMDLLETSVHKDSKFKYHEFLEFVKDNSTFFDEDLKVGLFGLGMLVKYTMNIQYANIRSTPFEKKLKGYDLSLDDANKIYLETLDKLRQYNASGAYPELREKIVPKFLFNKHNPSRLSKNEISLYFVAGLELAGPFKVKSDNQDEDSNQ